MHCCDDAESLFPFDVLIICFKIKMTKAIANNMKLPMNKPTLSIDSNVQGHISIMVKLSGSALLF